MAAALLAPLVLGCIGLVVDVGFVAVQRTRAQNAADAAALAAAEVLLNGSGPSAARSAALSYAESNGYQASDITVQIPPQTGPHAGQTSYVAVLVHHNQSMLFMRALHIESVSVSARGVAGFKEIPQDYALVVLDKTKCSAYSQSSGSTLNVNGGGVMVNSSCQPSGSLGGGSVLNASVINFNSNGSWSLSNNATTSVPPVPIGLQIDDPLASLAAPTPGAASPDSGGTATNPNTALVNANSPVTLHPGTYYGGLKIAGSGSVTFEPGTYVFAGGGLDYSGSSAISGSGVTFYNTGDPQHANGAGACGNLGIQGSGTLTLSAPTSGAYAGMLFWQDPACTQAMKYAGSSYTTSGVIYLPAAQLNVSGGGALGALQIVVDSFSYSGSSSVTINYTKYVQLFQPGVALVE